MKKFIKITAALVAAASAATLAGCAGCAGCGSKTKNLTLTSSNWYTGTSYPGIQPSFILDDEKPERTEKIVYGITFDNSAADNKSYYLEYKDGSYCTEFYATYYDWNSSHYQAEQQELVYCYKTQFSISVRYNLKSGAQSEWFDDSVTSECYFRAAGKNLQPVYSMQIIKSASPNKSSAKNISDAYKLVDVTYENYYNKDITEVFSVTQQADKQPESKTYSLNKVSNSLFDNSSLYIAVRSMKLSPDFRQTVSLFSAAAGGISQYTVAGSSAALDVGQHKEISTALAEKGLYAFTTVSDGDGKTVETSGINYTAANITYSGGSLTGTSQTVWYAAIDNPDNNTGRAVMLKLSVPLSYGLGTLNFTLKQVTSAMWSPGDN